MLLTRTVRWTLQIVGGMDSNVLEEDRDQRRLRPGQRHGLHIVNTALSILSWKFLLQLIIAIGSGCTNGRIFTVFLIAFNDRILSASIFLFINRVNGDGIYSIVGRPTTKDRPDLGIQCHC